MTCAYCAERALRCWPRLECLCGRHRMRREGRCDMSDQPNGAARAVGSRYSRQTLFPGIGADGQRKLGESSVLVAGCGAMGSALANNLVRAGVGRVRLVDRDFVEVNNLQRQ